MILAQFIIIGASLVLVYLMRYSGPTKLALSLVLVVVSIARMVLMA
jgi:hypothetical protein